MTAEEISKHAKNYVDKFWYELPVIYQLKMKMAYRSGMQSAIDMLNLCDHHWLQVGEWDGKMMMQCTKCNLYKEEQK